MGKKDKKPEETIQEDQTPWHVLTQANVIKEVCLAAKSWRERNGCPPIHLLGVVDVAVMLLSLYRMVPYLLLSRFSRLFPLRL
jgi:hypothetical protein